MCALLMREIVTFSIVQATNVSLVYTIDAYRPVAGEITVTQLAFKAVSTEFMLFQLSSLSVVGLRIPSLLLYKSMDRRSRLSEVFWRHGRNQRCCYAWSNTVLFLREENQACDLALADHEKGSSLG